MQRWAEPGPHSNHGLRMSLRSKESEYAAINEEKAKLVYDAIDGSGGFYRGVAAPDSRSRMNVTMNLPDADLEKRFIVDAQAAGLYNLKGHRSVGGVRASIYNAMPAEGCAALAQFMADFAKANG